MVSYELAKKLKDAGYVFHELRLGEDMGKDWVLVDGMQYVAPILSELIEACGDGLWEFMREGDGWSTFSKTRTVKIGPWPTPEEAVGHLWLALHEPKE